MSTNVNDTPTVTSGATNEASRVIALTNHPKAMDATAGRTPRMITSTHQPIAYIAETVGYGTPANFNRQFKRLTSLTPREYRANFRHN